MNVARILPCLVLLVVPAVLAGSAGVSDPEGDEFVTVSPMDRPGVPFVFQETCDAPAVDLLHADVALNGTIVEVRMRVADWGAPVDCPLFREDMGNRSWSSIVNFKDPTDQGAVPQTVSFSGHWSQSPGETQPQARATVVIWDGRWLYVCTVPSEGGMENGFLVARLGIRGTAECHGEPREYDLADREYVVRSFVEAEGIVHSATPAGRLVFGRYFARDLSDTFAYAL